MANAWFSVLQMVVTAILPGVLGVFPLSKATVPPERRLMISGDGVLGVRIQPEIQPDVILFRSLAHVRPTTDFNAPRHADDSEPCSSGQGL